MNVTEAYVRTSDGMVYKVGNITQFSVSTGPYDDIGVTIEGHAISVICPTSNIDVTDAVSFDEFTKLLEDS